MPDTLPWVVLAWSFGAFLLLARSLIQWCSTWSLIGRDTSAVPPRWESVVEQLKQRMGIHRSVRILATTRAMSPVMIGCFRPVILVPVFALTGLTAEQLRAVLAHELGHVRRYDYLFNLVQTLIECVLFYHPAVWWLSRRLRAEREFCCDDLAVRVSGDTPSYVRALSALDEMRDAHLALGMASNGGSLMTRIARLVRAQPSRSRRTVGWLAPALFAMTLTASASALTLSLPAGLQDQAVKQDSQAKGQKQAKEQKKADKNKKAKQTQAARKRAEKQAWADRKDADRKDKAKLKRKQDERYSKEKRAARIAEMRAKGMSAKQIERALYELRLEERQAQRRRGNEAELKQRKRRQDQIAKLRAAGLSDEEIEVSIKNMIRAEQAARREQREQARARELEARRQARIREMRAAGWSPDQIRAALAKSKKKRRKKEYRSDAYLQFRKQMEDRVAQLKARGASEAEIKKHIAELQQEYQVNMAQRERRKAENVRADKRKIRQREMIKEMRAKGMSGHEIEKAIADWRRQLELDERDLRKKNKKKRHELEKRKDQVRERRKLDKK